MKFLGSRPEASTVRPAVQRIQSESSQFRHIEALKRDRRKRWRHREFFVEGVRPLNRAMEEGWGLKTLLFSSERGLSGWAEEMLRRCRGAVRLDLAPDLLEALSDKEEPSEILGVVAMPENDPARSRWRRDCWRWWRTVRRAPGTSVVCSAAAMSSESTAFW
jgi:hypothetical protein